MLDVVTLLDGETELAARDMTDVLRFEISLANISLPRCANIIIVVMLIYNSIFLSVRNAQRASSIQLTWFVSLLPMLQKTYIHILGMVPFVTTPL